ncbi:hypothetical protein M0R19_05135 [Candidatus Pacearchaeota archaeon]|jgi:hypothetical protein|nr:hypothetical protein [Candidatus Pacearchaeota archaeon]
MIKKLFEKVINYFKEFSMKKEVKEVSQKDVIKFMADWTKKFENVKKSKDGWSTLYPILSFKGDEIRINLYNAPTIDVDINNIEQIVLCRNFLDAVIKKFS